MAKNSDLFSNNPRALIVTIEGLIPSLPPAERVIAETLLSLQSADPDEVRAVRIASAVNVSEAAVVKFAQHLGLSGFRELRSVFLKHQKTYAAAPQEEMAANGTSEALLRSIIRTSIRSLEDTAAVLDYDSFERAAQALAKARHRFLFGLGGSAPLVREFEHRLLDVGLTSRAHDEPRLLLRAATLATELDVVMAISHSGSTSALLDAVQHAHERGATTIGITNTPRSPLTTICHISLVTAARGSAVVGVKTMTKVVQLNMLYALGMKVAQYANRQGAELLSFEASDESDEP